MQPAPHIVARLEQYQRSHLLRFLDQLPAEDQIRLLAEVEALDLPLLHQLSHQFATPEASPHAAAAPIPVPVQRLPRTDADRVAWRHAAERGEAALAAGEVAVVIVAGGQGTRLGFDGPKGTYPIGPVSACSLFQIHAEKVVALARRYGRIVPLYIMTSPENHQATVQFFDQNDRFGLDHVRFFTQGQMPAVDLASGRILLAAPGRLAMSPDGHGGTLSALAAPGADGSPGCLEEMRDLGVETLFYFQVDNPLVKVADPAFLGIHRNNQADVSFKVVEKIRPDEKVGVVVELDGHPQVIEYSDLPPSLAELRDPEGTLRLWAGSIAIHIFERRFIEHLVASARLPFHRALKKVSHVDDRGDRVQPTHPNAIKFERFIFDSLPLAERYAIVETDRSIEFEPLKNAVGPDSPATVRQRMSDLFAGWLESASAQVVRRGDGCVPFGIEISPLFALDASELREKLPQGLVVEKPLLLR